MYLPEELCGSPLPQQSPKGYSESPDVIIEAQFDDSDLEDGHGNTQNVLVDDIKKLSVGVHERGEYGSLTFYCRKLSIEVLFVL